MARRRRVWTIVLAVGLFAAIGVAAWRAVAHIRADLHYRAALAAIDRREFATARGHLDECIRAWPESAETRFLAARTARRAGDPDAARRLLREAERLGWVPTAITLERSLLVAQDGNHASVAGYLAYCVRNDHPDTLLILEVLVPSALRAYDLALADETADLWTQREPDDPRPYLFKGEVAERLRNTDEALRWYREAAGRAPDHYDARLRFARLAAEKNRPDEARPGYEWCLAARPDDPQARLGLARVLHDLGRDAEVRPILDRLLRERPADAEALALAGVLDLDEGRPVEAERSLKRAAELAPFAPDVLFNYARCLDRLGHVDEARAVRERRERAAKDLEEVAALVREVVERPTDPAPRREIALRLRRNGLEAEAKRWFDSARQPQ